MDLANLSIKRPTFITCVIGLMLIIGFISLKNLPVDLFPNVNFPIVTVTTLYPGSGPQEIETLVSKILEDEIATIAGIKSIRSINREGVSIVVCEFTLETDIKYAEQQVRDRVSAAKRKLPDEIKEPTIRRVSPSDQPIMTITLSADLPPAELFDLADETIRPKIEQVNQVGLVEVYGGRKREIHVDIDQNKLKNFELSASLVSQRLAASGQNIPVGKVEQPGKEVVLRTLGEFTNLEDIKRTIVNFGGNEVPVSLSDIATVKDGLVDETNRVFVNGDKTLVLSVYRQTGANTIRVNDAVAKEIDKIQKLLENSPGKPKLKIVRTAAQAIKANVADVYESIIIGIILTILVVYFFLANARSTIITGLALPNSLLGAFILMSFAGFTVNVMTLLALSLAVGLLVDDAIVVRENIHRHRMMGKSPIKSAIDGTKEVSLAVVATTLAVIAVFGPIGFLQGVVGQFFREFGLTICFAMFISLFDALTIAPMMSAYFGGSHATSTNKLYNATLGAMLRGFEKFQNFLEFIYLKVLKFSIRLPYLVGASALAIFVLSLFVAAKYVPKTFLPPQDNGEFSISLDLPPGTNLQTMEQFASKVDQALRAHKEVETSVLTVGSKDGQVNVADFYVQLVPSKFRKVNTSEFKQIIREEFKQFAEGNPVVKDFDAIGGGIRPFNVNIVGSDLLTIEKYAHQLLTEIKNHPALNDVDWSYRPGKPEVQYVIDRTRAERLGVSSNIAGAELRNLVEGQIASIYRKDGKEYDIRVRLFEDQRDLSKRFDQTFIPNINGRLIKLANIATKVDTTGPATINRQDRGRYIQISADIAANGPGMGAAMTDIEKILSDKIKLPQGMRYVFVGQAESFIELIQNMIIAVLLSIIFIYLVLSSLYESFVTPFTIMLVLPLAICGAIFALFITGKSIDLNSMIGCILLLGIATKNSILLVDYATQKIQEGTDRDTAMLEAGKTRLRPILMTTVALIAGMLPIAIGLNEASKQRTSMGVAIIGGLISSTLLSLVVVPAAFSFVDRFRVWSKATLSRIFISKEH